MGGFRLSVQERARARRLRGEGYTLREIGQIMDRSFGGLGAVLRTAPTAEAVPTPSPVYVPGRGRLGRADRDEIVVGLVEGKTLAEIAARIGRHPSTVCREVARNGGRDRYRPGMADERARRQARRPKPTKLGGCPALTDEVVAGLEQWWSPEEIARRLRADHPDDPMMRVSHETIYQSLYVQGRGELRRELTRCLRTGRAQRRPQGRLERRGRIPDMVMISERPAEVADRAVPGHWEGDLIVGKNGKSQVGTLVERSTRYVMLLELPDGRAETVRAAMQREIATLPAHLFRSLTWDQGKEMSAHATFTVTTGVPVYFCDPHSPWQRGSNENTNGLLRGYMPKGKDLSALTQDNLNWIADSLNGRPRQTLNWATPAEKMAELIASTG